MINFISDNNILTEENVRLESIINKAIPDVSKNNKECNFLYFYSGSIAYVDLMFLSKKIISKNKEISYIEDVEEYKKQSSSIGVLDILAKKDNFEFNTASLSDFEKLDEIATDDSENIEKIFYLKFDLYLFCKKLGRDNILNHHLILNSNIINFRNMLSLKINIYNFRIDANIFEYKGSFKEYYNIRFYVSYLNASKYVDLNFESIDFLNDDFFKEKLNIEFEKIFTVEWDFTKIPLEQYLDNLSLLSY